MREDEARALKLGAEECSVTLAGQLGNRDENDPFINDESLIPNLKK